MSDYVVVRVEGNEIAVREWATWADAVSAWRPEAGRSVTLGEAWIADVNGDPIDPGGTVVDGASIAYHPGKEGR